MSHKQDLGSDHCSGSSSDARSTRPDDAAEIDALAEAAFTGFFSEFNGNDERGWKHLGPTQKGNWRRAARAVLRAQGEYL